MKKFITICLASLVVFFAAVDAQAARRQVKVAKGSRLAYESEGYYVLNRPSGFVIYGAWDGMYEVLGYGVGQFEYDSLPDNVRSWLSYYDEEAMQAELYFDYTDEQVADDIMLSTSTTAAIEPLITTQWNQNAPYNDSCPAYSGTTLSATGCVATATAQIMRYYKYPARGTGSNTYKWGRAENDSVELTVDFSQSVYDWSNMPVKLTSSSAAIEKAAVSKLMYDIGVATKMKYGKSSATSSYNSALALTGYFDYDRNIEVVRTDLVKVDSMKRLLESELKSRRPVIYSGWTEKNSGHAFIIDGMDSDGFFHVNWGWGGNSDGYYQLSALKPTKAGTGGSTDGYQKNQYAIVGIQPNTGQEVTVVPMIGIDSLLTGISSEQLAAGDVQLESVVPKKVQNYGVQDITNMHVAIALADERTQEVKYIVSNELSGNLRSQYYWTNNRSYAVKDGFSAANGAYRLYAVYRTEEMSTWLKLRTYYEDVNYKHVYVSDNKIYLYDTSKTPQLKFNSPITFSDNDNVRQGDNLDVNMSVVDGGILDGYITGFVYSGATRVSYLGIMPLTLYRSESTTISIPLTTELAAGEYEVKIAWRQKPTSWVVSNDENATVKIAVKVKDEEPTRLSELAAYDGRVEIYSIDGLLCYEGEATTLSSLNLRSGIYVVRADRGSDIAVFKCRVD